MSSNFVFLNQLFSRARLHASDADSDRVSSFKISHVSPAGGSGYSAYVSSLDSAVQDSQTRNPNVAAAISSHLPAGRLSIVNLLYNEEAALPPSRPDIPAVASANLHNTSSSDVTADRNSREDDGVAEFTESTPKQSSSGGQENFNKTNAYFYSGNQQESNSASKSAKVSSRISNKGHETEYVRIFFNNLHHLHPFLLVDEFTSRCEHKIWNSSLLEEPQQEHRHFLALYNIVVAVGALIAGKDLVVVSESGTGYVSEDGSKTEKAPSSMAMSVIYFRKSRMLLGDVFEVCSLESAQTLFLMVSIC